jgi:DDE superfamily endonuclease
MSGPYPAGTPDIAIFRNGGLKDMIPGGKKAIADKGYRGEPKISIPNPEYPKFVTKFHTRARCRQESFNFRIKTFDVLKVQFRHGIDKHKIAFEAVCVIMQYQLESGSPLFTI